MTLVSKDFWHYQNISSYTLQPPMNPTSYFLAERFIREVGQRHGLSTEDMIAQVEKEDTRSSKLSGTLLLKAKIEKQTAVIIRKYQQALNEKQTALAELWEREYENLDHLPMNLAYLQLHAAAGSLDEAICFINDLTEIAMLHQAVELNYIIGQLEAEYPELHVQGFLYSVYFSSVFPGKEE